MLELRLRVSATFQRGRRGRAFQDTLAQVDCRALQVVQQRVHQRALLPVPCRGVDHHAGRLVDHQQVGVLKHNVQGNVLQASLALSVTSMWAVLKTRGLSCRLASA